MGWRASYVSIYQQQAQQQAEEPRKGVKAETETGPCRLVGGQTG